jgi:hypothetical protein
MTERARAASPRLDDDIRERHRRSSDDQGASRDALN